MDALRLKIKTLLEESRTMQASIQQLTVQEQSNAHAGVFSDHPVVLGLESLLVGAAALCLGGLLGSGLAWRRMRTASAPNPAGYGESVYNFHSTDEAQHPVADEVQESISPPLTPVLEQQPDSGSGFDFEAAANEVQRVRRSLADKRAARDRWNASDAHHADPTPPEEPWPDMVPLDFDQTASEDQALDIDLDIDLDAMKSTDDEGSQDPGVKLALAQEFLSLGLLDGAREFAMEFMDSTEAPLHSQAMTLISQIEAQEQQEKERVQQAKIQAQQDLAAMFASLPTQ
jgi:hypothetical protein